MTKIKNQIVCGTMLFIVFFSVLCLLPNLKTPTWEVNPKAKMNHHFIVNYSVKSVAGTERFDLSRMPTSAKLTSDLRLLLQIEIAAKLMSDKHIDVQPKDIILTKITPLNSNDIK